MPVHFGVQALQGLEFSERGVARYVGDLADALWRLDPELIGTLVLDGRSRLPGRLEPYVGRGVLGHGQDLHPVPGDVYHLTSPFEATDLDRLWPLAVRRSGCRLVVTVYDLIPLLNPDRYLRSDPDRHWYANRVRVLRLADRVHTISQATAADAIECLGLRPERVRVVGTGVSPIFVPADERPAPETNGRGGPAAHKRGSRAHTSGRVDSRALTALHQRLPAVRPGFLLCTGGADWRKNLTRLLAAYRALPEPMRQAHQLVIVCKLDWAGRAGLEGEIDRLGLGRQVLLTGLVPDADLVHLYQATELFIFPSLHEGFGLPLAEAMACGAPAICSSVSSLAEILPDPRAHFDPEDPRSIRDAVERAVTDPRHLAALRSHTLDRRHRWPAVAERTAASYRELLASRRSARRGRVRLALVSPLPPTATGVADYNARLATSLARRCDVTVFVDDMTGVVPPPGVDVRLVSELDTVEAEAGPFDRVICAIGNQTFHISAIQLLQTRRCTVVFHDVRLDGLWAWSAVNRPDFAPRTFHQQLHAQYHGRIPPDLGGRGWLERDEAEQWAIWMVGDIVRQADEAYGHSRYAADMAMLDAGPANTTPVGVLPFAYPPVAPRPARPAAPQLVATFGVVSAVKSLDLVLSTMFELGRADPDLHFAIVGAVSDDLRNDCLAGLRAAGLADRCVIPGRVRRADYSDWLARATIALQLRASSGGESSAAIADCLAAGVPTIVTDIGAQSELDDSCVKKVDRSITPGDLARITRELLDDPLRLSEMGRAAQAYAAERSFTKVADEVYRRAVVGRDRVGHRL